MKVKVVMAILDSCREFQEHDVVDSASRGGTRLAVGSMGFSSTIIAYAAAPNGHALDGTGKHGT